MQDKSLFTSNQPQTVSKGLQNFIDAMVEEIVLDGKPFDTQKKYLRKFSENEGLDYEAIENGITELIETLGEMKSTDSKSLMKLALIQAKEACVTEEAVVGIVGQIGKKVHEPQYAKQIALGGIIQSLQNRSGSATHKMNESNIDFNVNGVEFRMVKVEGGTFWMGAHNQYRKKGLFSKEPDTSIPNFDEEAKAYESPVHKVTLDSFYLSKIVVTQALWRIVMGTEPEFEGGWKEMDGRGDNYPAYRVSYNEIVYEFLPKLNQLTGKGFRLPTEAEWEYAARGGNRSQGYKYAGSNWLADVAWFSENRVHPVRMKQANELGLHDMSGNVWELCSDWYGNYGSEAQTNPKGPMTVPSNPMRVCRGGSWLNHEPGCFRVAFRSCALETTRNSIVGFRLALSETD